MRRIDMELSFSFLAAAFDKLIEKERASNTSLRVAQGMSRWFDRFEESSLPQRRVMARGLSSLWVKGYNTVLEGRIREFTKNEGAIEDLVVEMALALIKDKAELRIAVEQIVPTIVAKHHPDCDHKPPEWIRRALERIAAKAYA